VPSSRRRLERAARAVINGRVDLICGEKERVVKRRCGRIVYPEE
jgi:hypothetical protein